MTDANRKYFTVGEASAMIRMLEEHFGRMLQLQAQIRGVYERLDASGYAPDDDEFDVVPVGASPEVVNELATLRTLVDALKADVGSLYHAGCIVKDIDQGLVDWYAKKGEREVLLCWRLGEKSVGFWHDVDAGFAGRRSIETFYD